MEKDKKLPNLLHHILNPDSRKVGFGYQVFAWSTYAFIFVRLPSGSPLLDAQTWLMCVGLAGTLIGGGTVADKWLDRQKPKEGGNANP